MERTKIYGNEGCVSPLTLEGEPFCLAFLIPFRVRPAKAKASQLYFNSKTRSLAPLQGTGAYDSNKKIKKLKNEYS